MVSDFSILNLENETNEVTMTTEQYYALAIMDDCGKVTEEIPWTRCPVCGEPLKKVENG